MQTYWHLQEIPNYDNDMWFVLQEPMLKLKVVILSHSQTLRQYTQLPDPPLPLSLISRPHPQAMEGD